MHLQSLGAFNYKMIKELGMFDDKVHIIIDDKPSKYFAYLCCVYVWHISYINQAKLNVCVVL